ncbi:hypothetical protein TEA_008535 [Camellia sinensis var. sinensis]|uniref:Uncharacterized protein n=1 Tax=Camellia sinensis var. sinensis TaxID=542762 RepID=A0A4S4DJY1_CAMSN|nr:hypothetical protein TEA_008535 [Camellia sinensis var. sinensis]
MSFIERGSTSSVDDDCRERSNRIRVKGLAQGQPISIGEVFGTHPPASSRLCFQVIRRRCTEEHRLGQQDYTRSVLFVEYLLQPEQLNKIFELCGSPDEIIWPGVSKIPWYNKFKPTRPMKRRVREVFRHFDRHALDLLEKMLTLDPSQGLLIFGSLWIALVTAFCNSRISAKDALDAEYFWTDPLPCDPRSLPKYESSHEFQTKKKRQQQRQNEEMAKRQKLQHPQQHARLPPIQQTGQTHPQHWSGPNPMNNSQAPVSAGPSHHHYGKPRGPPGGPNRYPPSGNPSGGYYPDRGGQGGGYSSGSYPPQGRGPPYPGSGVPATGGPRGAPPSGYGVGAPNYSQGGQYGGSVAGRGQNPMGGNRNKRRSKQDGVVRLVGVHHWSCFDNLNRSMLRNRRALVSAGPSHHHYGKPRGPPGGPNRYPPSSNPSGGYYPDRGGQGGGYSSGSYPPQGRGPPYPGSGVPATGSSRGAPPSGYGVGTPNYSQGGQYGGSVTGRGQNPMGGNRNQQYG